MSRCRVELIHIDLETVLVIVVNDLIHHHFFQVIYCVFGISCVFVFKGLDTVNVQFYFQFLWLIRSEVLLLQYKFSEIVLFLHIADAVKHSALGQALEAAHSEKGVELQEIKCNVDDLLVFGVQDCPYFLKTES